MSWPNPDAYLARPYDIEGDEPAPDADDGTCLAAVEDPTSHAGLAAAYAKNQARQAESAGGAA